MSDIHWGAVKNRLHSMYFWLVDPVENDEPYDQWLDWLISSELAVSGKRNK